MPSRGTLGKERACAGPATLRKITGKLLLCWPSSASAGVFLGGVKMGERLGGGRTGWGKGGPVSRVTRERQRSLDWAIMLDQNPHPQLTWSWSEPLQPAWTCTCYFAGADASSSTGVAGTYLGQRDECELQSFPNLHWIPSLAAPTWGWHH